MAAPHAVPTLAAIAPLAARSFASGEELAAAVLGLARDLLGLDTALVAHVDGETWVAVHAQGGFGIRPGDCLPLRDTF